MRYMTLLGQLVDVDADPRLERFYDSILASPNGGAAEDLLYGPANPLAAGLELRDGLPVWTAAVLRDPRWTFLLDAVAEDHDERARLDFVRQLAGPGVIDCPAIDPWVAALQARGWLPEAPALEPNPEGDGQIGRWTLTDKGRAEFARLEAGR